MGTAGSSRAGLSRRLALAIGAPLLLLAAGEAALLLLDWPPPQLFDLLTGRTSFSVPDRELFWRLRAGETLEEEGEFRMSISPRGFRDGDWSPSPREGVRRILCLGDSCTFGRATTYPRELSRILDAELGPGTVEILNAGIPGYSTFQALLLLRGPLREDRFDLLVVSCGFNDSKSSPLPDSARRPPPEAAWTLRAALGRLRLYQCLTRLRVALAKRRTAPTTRVPVEEYRANLLALDAEARARGARALFLTVPSLLPPESEQGQALAARNDAVRAAAAEAGAALLDLERRFAQIGPRGLFDGAAEPAEGTQIPDPIHPNELGLRLVAESVRELIAARGLLRGIPGPSREEPISGSFAFSVGDLDGDGAEEVAACAERSGSLVACLLDPRGRRSWTREIPGRPTGGPVFLAALRAGEAFFALDASDGSVVEFRGEERVHAARLPLAELGGRICGFAVVDLDGDGGEEPTLAVEDPDGGRIEVLTGDLSRRASFPLRLPGFALERDWRGWAIAPSPPRAGRGRFLAAPDAAVPRPGWLGFFSSSEKGDCVDGTAGFGFGGFDAGVRLAPSRTAPRAFAARGACLRVFERVHPSEQLPWLAVDAVFPFGFSSDPLRGGGCAIAVRNEKEGGRILLVAGEEAGRAILELDARGEVRGRIPWP